METIGRVQGFRDYRVQGLTASTTTTTTTTSATTTTTAPIY